MENFDKRMMKKTSEELQAYLAFRRKAGRVPSKKGKGSYDRKAFKKIAVWPKKVVDKQNKVWYNKTREKKENKKNE